MRYNLISVDIYGPNMATIDEAVKKAFKETLRSELKNSHTEERYFILAGMLKNLDIPLGDLKTYSADDLKFSESYGGSYFLSEQSRDISNVIKTAFDAHNFLDQLADKIIEQVEETTYPDWRQTNPQAFLESSFYQQFCQVARNLSGVKEHDMGHHIVFRGIPTIALDPTEINKFFSKPHRGTELIGKTPGLMDYAISTPKRPSLAVGNSTGRATQATSMSLSADVAFDYATKKIKNRFGEVINNNNGWMIVARAGKGVNPQLTQNRWYAEITMDEIPPGDILAVCEVSKSLDHLNGELYTIGTIHTNPNLGQDQLKELNDIAWLKENEKIPLLSLKDREEDILATSLSKRLLLGGPLLEVDHTVENVFDTIPTTPEETLMYQLLQDALIYVAKYPEQSLAHDRHPEALKLAETIINALKKNERVDLKLKEVGDCCQDIVNKRNKGGLSGCATKFLEESSKLQPKDRFAKHTVYRIRSEDAIKKGINAFEDLKAQLVKTGKSSPGVFDKFMAWLKSCFSSKPEITQAYKAKLGELCSPAANGVKDPKSHRP
jgi:hypothetical protein